MKEEVNYHGSILEKHIMHLPEQLKYLFLIFILACTSLTISAQVLTPTEDIKVFEENRIFYLEAYPHILAEAEITGIEPLNEKHTKIYYTVGETKYETVVNSARKGLLLIASCQEIPLEKLPAIVRDATFNQTKDGWEIVKAFIVQTPYSSEFYRVDIQAADSLKSQIKALFFDHLGQYVEPPY